MRISDWSSDVCSSDLHGDMWGGNVLARGGRIAAFVDPAIYHADPEIELAFSTLFGTYGEAFFRRYEALRPLRPGFFETRRDIYNLYPLLVHARLFGGSYVASVDRILGRFVKGAAGPAHLSTGLIRVRRSEEHTSELQSL